MQSSNNNNNTNNQSTKKKKKKSKKSTKVNTNDLKSFTIDAILKDITKGLLPGQTVSIPLYKGQCTTTSVDALLAARTAAANAKNITPPPQQQQQHKTSSEHRLLATNEKFPKIAKFTETVSKPNFHIDFCDGRMYHEDIPKVKDDEEEEDDVPKLHNNNNNNSASTQNDDVKSTNDSNNKNNNGNPLSPTKMPPSSSASATTTTTQQQLQSSSSPPPPAITKRKKRWKRNQVPKKHWLLLTKKEWQQKVVYKKILSQDPERALEMEQLLQNQRSIRYEGTPESTSGTYVFFRPQAKEDNTYSIAISPVHNITNFTQPAKFHTLSMEDAEKTIQLQRSSKIIGVRARLLKFAEEATTTELDGGGVVVDATTDTTKTGDTSTNLVLEGGDLSETKLKKDSSLSTQSNTNNTNKSSTKASTTKRKRYTKKTKYDPDDIMADLTFQKSRSGGSTATNIGSSSSQSRKELLSSLGDADLTVDHDGILGGTNDAEFGGRRRFGRFNAQRVDPRATTNSKIDDDGVYNTGRDNTATATSISATNDGMAMDTDFYKRDVGAEYDELDYDANELFDNDDVDMGAGEIFHNNDPDGGEGNTATDGVADGQDGLLGNDDDDDFMSDDGGSDGEDDRVARQVWKDVFRRDEIAGGNANTSVSAAITASGLGSSGGSLSSLNNNGGGHHDAQQQKHNAVVATLGGVDAVSDGERSIKSQNSSASKNRKIPTSSSNITTNIDSSTNPSQQQQNETSTSDNRQSDITGTQPPNVSSAAAASPSSSTATTTTKGGLSATLTNKKLVSSPFDTSVIEVDANGDRLLSQTSVRREIWLHSGAMPFKKLKKIFKYKNSDTKRKKQFQNILKELCTTRKDPVEGNMMVLKQHYAKNI